MKPHRKICCLCSHLSAESSNFPGSKRNCVCYLYAYSRFVFSFKSEESRRNSELCVAYIYQLNGRMNPEKYNRPTLYPQLFFVLLLFFFSLILCEIYEQSQKSVFYFLILQTGIIKNKINNDTT